MGEVTLTQRDQLRLKVLQQWSCGSYTTAQAVELLGCTVRHARRLLAAYRASDVASIPHGNRGRPPAHKLDQATARQAIARLRDEYAQFNNHHAQEMLAEFHGLSLSVSTVRRLRLQAGLCSPRKRRAPKHRCRRERRPQAGMLLQIDGSPHRWLGPQGPQACLLVAVDDATGELFARFEEQENCLGYLRLLKSIIAKKGLPVALYSDRHTIFRSPKAKRLSVDEQLAGAAPKTQFSRACEELGIGIITAHSPQAKGRVENHNRTLQDRLVAELRHQRIDDLKEAQGFLAKFLPRFNRRFNVPAQDAEPAYRPAPSKEAVKDALCLKFERCADNDNTVSFGNRRLQLPKTQQSFARSRVEIRVGLQGHLSFWKDKELIGSGPQLRGANLATVQGLATLLPPSRPTGKAPKAQSTARREKAQPPIPGPEHPWRRFTYGQADRRSL